MRRKQSIPDLSTAPAERKRRRRRVERAACRAFRPGYVDGSGSARSLRAAARPALGSSGAARPWPGRRAFWLWCVAEIDSASPNGGRRGKPRPDGSSQFRYARSQAGLACGGLAGERAAWGGDSGARDGVRVAAGSRGNRKKI